MKERRIKNKWEITSHPFTCLLPRNAWSEKWIMPVKGKWRDKHTGLHIRHAADHEAPYKLMLSIKTTSIKTRSAIKIYSMQWFTDNYVWNTILLLCSMQYVHSAQHTKCAVYNRPHSGNNASHDAMHSNFCQMPKVETY